MKNKIINISFLMLCLLLSAIPLFAQPTPPTPSAPVDGGLSLLIAGGIGYGIKKVRAKKKDK